MVVGVQAMLDCDLIAGKWLQAVAKSFGLPVNSFDGILAVTEGETPASRLEFIQYTLPKAQAHRHISCKEHVDRGLLTLIYSDHGHGLQVCVVTQFEDIPCIQQVHHQLHIVPALQEAHISAGS